MASVTTSSLSKTPISLLSLPAEIRLPIFEHLAKGSTLSMSPLRDGETGNSISNFLKTMQCVIVVYDEGARNTGHVYRVKGPAKQLLTVSSAFAAEVLVALCKFGFEIAKPAGVIYLPPPTMATMAQEISIDSYECVQAHGDRWLELFTRFLTLKRVKITTPSDWAIIPAAFDVQCDSVDIKARLDEWSRGWNARHFTREMGSWGYRETADIWVALFKQGRRLNFSWSEERFWIWRYRSEEFPTPPVPVAKAGPRKRSYSSHFVSKRPTQTDFFHPNVADVIRFRHMGLDYRIRRRYLDHPAGLVEVLGPLGSRAGLGVDLPPPRILEAPDAGMDDRTGV